jgi:hypothetical protein
MFCRVGITDNERGRVMNDELNKLDSTEEYQLFACEVSDETLEAAANTGNETVQNFTYRSCTLVPYCPA